MEVFWLHPQSIWIQWECQKMAPLIIFIIIYCKQERLYMGRDNKSNKIRSKARKQRKRKEFTQKTNLIKKSSKKEWKINFLIWLKNSFQLMKVMKRILLIKMILTLSIHHKLLMRLLFWKKQLKRCKFLVPYWQAI